MRRDINTKLKATLSPRDVAEITGFGITNTYRMLNNGTLPHIRVGNRFYVPRAALEKWLASCGKVE